VFVKCLTVFFSCEVKQWTDERKGSTQIFPAAYKCCWLLP